MTAPKPSKAALAICRAFNEALDADPQTHICEHGLLPHNLCDLCFDELLAAAIDADPGLRGLLDAAYAVLGYEGDAIGHGDVLIRLRAALRAWQASE